MGFQRDNTAQTVTPFARPQGQNDNWKADAFLNVYLPTSNGRRKVGFIPLKANRAFDAAIIKRLATGTDEEKEEAMKSFMDVVQIDFHLAEADDENLPQF